MTRLVFELPLPPNMANGRMHWAIKRKWQQDYYTVCDARVVVKGWQVPRPIPGMPWPKASAEIQMRSARQMDHDNAHARLKWPLDWLQSRGYIKNDRDLSYQLDARTAKKIDRGVTIVLREVLSDRD